MTEQKRFPWLPVLLGVGCVAVLCGVVLVGGGGAAFFLKNRTEAPYMPEPAATIVIVEPTSVYKPTSAASPAPEPTEPRSTLTGAQSLTEYSLFDDFSSEALRWPVYSGDVSIMGYDNQAYSIQITEPEYFDFVPFPVDFIPYEIWFDVQGLSGTQDGTFGAFCHFQDLENYYYVEIDLETKEYLIGQFYEDESIALTKQNSAGHNWWETNTLKSSPAQVNRIGLSCYLDSITLFINDQLVEQVDVEKPFDQPGEAAFFVFAYDFAGPAGYKVFFDNVETYQPQQ